MSASHEPAGIGHVHEHFYRTGIGRANRQSGSLRAIRSGVSGRLHCDQCSLECRGESPPIIVRRCNGLEFNHYHLTSGNQAIRVNRNSLSRPAFQEHRHRARRLRDCMPGNLECRALPSSAVAVIKVPPGIRHDSESGMRFIIILLYDTFRKHVRQPRSLPLTRSRTARSLPLTTLNINRLSLPGRL